MKNATRNEKVQVNEEEQKQQEYCKKLELEGFDFGLVFADAFVKGIRDIGYKSTATAINELIDNSIQAGADNIHVLFGYYPENTSQKKCDMIAVVDNGHGMLPTMIRAAVIWGGTHRFNDRQGFGRYGYGLPSSSVSIGQAFSVYSKTKDGDWNKVTIDLEDIAKGKYTENGHIITPMPVAETIPKWIAIHIEEKIPSFESGTVVIIDKIDRLTYSTIQKLREFFLQIFGVTYRNFLREIGLYVDSKKVEPIDPLFITEGYRFYDIDEDRAEASTPLNIEVKYRDSKEVAGIVKARFSYMPPTFLRVPEDKSKERGKNNERFYIRKKYNGIIVLRAGRVIDVVNSNCPWTTFQNNDRYIGVEVDFPPVLDEDFSMTTSKQQVVIHDRIWDILENNGVYEAIKQMRSRWSKENRHLKVEKEREDKKRPSEHAMEEAQKFLTVKPGGEAPDQKRQSEENFEREVERRAKKSGMSEEEVRHALIAEAQGRPFRVDFEDLPGAPFYRVEQQGGQKVLFINREHRFYRDLYAAPDSTPHSRYAQEVLLFVLGHCELRARSDLRLFYEAEKAEWSKYLSLALDRLSQWESTEDDLAAEIETAEAEEEAGKRATAASSIE